MTVVLTGGTGFVGSHLARRLVADGEDVHLLGRPGTDRWRLAAVADALTFHAVDLADADDQRRLGPLLADLGPSRLFHLAGAPLVAGTGADAASTFAVNVFGTAALLEAAAAVAGCSIVITGDAFEYGTTGRPLREADADVEPGAPGPTSLHGITRLIADGAARALGAATGTPIAVVRLFSVHGPDDHPQRLIPRLVEAARTGAAMPLSAPEVVRDWVPVDAVVDLLLKAAAQPSDGAPATERAFNAASGTPVTVGQLADLVAETTGRPIDARWGAFPLTEHDAGHWVGDPTRARSVLGWETPDPIAALRTTIERLAR